MKRFSLAFAAMIALVVLMGAGCGSSAPTSGTETPSTETPSAGLQVMRAGDKVILQEPAAVIEGKYVGESVERRVTINSFVMGKTSEGAYELVKEQDTKKVVTTGAWQFATLNTTHNFYFPGVMDAKTRPIGESAILFLPREEYRELASSSGTTIDPRFREEIAWQERMKADPAAARGYAALSTLIGEADDAKKDLTYARKEKVAQQTVRINGQPVSVEVLTLRNWYGVYEIINHPDVPLILSFRLDPKVDAKRLDVKKGDGAALASLANYQVKELIYVGR